MTIGPKACPKCKLLSDPVAVTCDCGYSFVTGEVSVRPGAAVPKTKAELDDALEVAAAYRSAVLWATGQLVTAGGLRGVMLLLRHDGGGDGSSGAVAIAGLLGVGLMATCASASRAAGRLSAAARIGDPATWAAMAFVPSLGALAMIALLAKAADRLRRYGLTVGMIGPSQASVRGLERASGAATLPR